MANDYFVLSTRLLPGTKARAEDVNTKFDDVEDGFDKLPAPHATLTGFSDPIAAGNPTDKEHAVNVTTALGGGLEYAEDTGAANAYLVDLDIAPASYRDGLTIRFKAANANTGASTINVNSLGIKTLYRNTGAAMQSGDILAGTIVTAIYNGNAFYCSAATTGQFNALQTACEDAADSASADAATVATDKGIVAADKATVAADKAIVAADKATVAGYMATTEGYKDDAETAAAAAESAVQSAISELQPFRNLVINGGFDIWQRGTSQTSSGYGSDDRWVNVNVGTTKTHSRQSFTLGQTDVSGSPTYFSRTVVSSVAGASNICQKLTRIEGVKKTAGKTVTISFNAKADSSKNIAVNLGQLFGTGGSPSSSIYGIGAQKVALTSSWQRLSVTIAVPSISGKTLGTNGDDRLALAFVFDAGSDFDTETDSLGQQSGTFDIANVQLEINDIATDFEQRPVGVEISLCQRYYQSYNTMRFSSSGGTATFVGATVPFTTMMRTTPTVTYEDNSANSLKWTSATSGDNLSISGGSITIGNDRLEIAVYLSAAVGDWAKISNVELDAEL